MNVLEEAGADVEFLGCPRRLGGVFVQAEVGDGLLGGVNVALLLVVIKKAGGGVEVFGIGDQRGVGVVAELAQVLGVAEEIEITFDELRIPERLESLLVDRESFANRSFAIFDHRGRFHGKDLIVGELLAVVGDELRGGGIFFLRDQELQQAGVERLLLRIAGDPGAILGDGSIFRQSLSLNYAEDALEGLPGTLFGGSE